jgi:hypothetical protein
MFYSFRNLIVYIYIYTMRTKKKYRHKKYSSNDRINRDQKPILLDILDKINNITKRRLHYNHLPIHIQDDIAKIEKYVNRIHMYITSQYLPYDFGGPRYEGDIFFNENNIIPLEEDDRLREVQNSLIRQDYDNQKYKQKNRYKLDIDDINDLDSYIDKKLSKKIKHNNVNNLIDGVNMFMPNHLKI